MTEVAPAATAPIALPGGRWGRIARTLVDFAVRRRILLSGILFALLIAENVSLGIKPHDVSNLGDPWTAVGLSLVVVGLALRSWAVGILHKGTQLTTTGPYAIIRNPLYVGSFLMMFGFCALLGDPKNFLLVVGPMLVLYVLKVRDEERVLSAKFTTAWKQYVEHTPRFLPSRIPATLAADWRLSQWLTGREYQALLTTIAALVALQLWRQM